MRVKVTAGERKEEPKPDYAVIRFLNHVMDTYKSCTRKARKKRNESESTLVELVKSAVEIIKSDQDYDPCLFLLKAYEFPLSKKYFDDFLLPKIKENEELNKTLQEFYKFMSSIKPR